MEADPRATLADRFGRLLVALEAELDWELLGRLYCWEGGDDFFAPAQREAVREAGLLIAADLAELLAELPPGGSGRSLYLGPGVAELAPMLCEHALLEREVLAVALPTPEIDELARAVAAVVGPGERRPFELRTDGLGFAPLGADHGWIVSVLTDPEAFPALHDALYERTGQDATGRGDRERELSVAGALVEQFLDHLRPPCILSTTDEELELVIAACARRGWRVEVPERARLSPVVGDPVRHCRVVGPDARLG